jgi:hypothetical protein
MDLQYLSMQRTDWLLLEMALLLIGLIKIKTGFELLTV